MLFPYLFLLPFPLLTTGHRLLNNTNMRGNIPGLLQCFLLSLLQNINFLRKPSPERLRMESSIRRKPCREGRLNLLALIDFAGGGGVLDLDFVDGAMLFCEGLDR
jgi:hypothetical protein